MRYGTAPAARGSYTASVVNNIVAGLERILRLEEQLALAPIKSLQRRKLEKAIGIEADLYRKCLDNEQANRPAMRDRRKLMNPETQGPSGPRVSIDASA